MARALIFALVIALSAFAHGEIKAVSDRDGCLRAHNDKRALHRDTPSVTWDASLAAGAQRWAEQLARRGGLQHSRGDYGENLYMAGGWSSTPKSCSAAVESWYSEISKYNWNRPRYTSGVGHFTQIVWKNSRRIGVGIAFNTYRKSTYIVARYSPAGNMLGRFAENVQPLKRRVMADYGCEDKDEGLCTLYKSLCGINQGLAEFCKKTCKKC